MRENVSLKCLLSSNSRLLEFCVRLNSMLVKVNRLLCPKLRFLVRKMGLITNIHDR